MHEREEDHAALQRILDESYALAGEHLLSVFSPERSLSARELSRRLRGAFRLELAAVTRDGAPLVAPVDGLLFRGHVWFSLPPGSVRARLLRARPPVSGTHTRDGEVCIVVHGVAREVPPSSFQYAEYETCLREVYGPLLEASREHYRSRSGSEYTAWIEPRRFFATVPL